MKTHDYTSCSWGHNYMILDIQNDGLNVRLSGWGMGISVDDYLLLRNGEDSTRYKVSSIQYQVDPNDMWFADVVFAPREAVNA